MESSGFYMPDEEFVGVAEHQGDEAERLVAGSSDGMADAEKGLGEPSGTAPDDCKAAEEDQSDERETDERVLAVAKLRDAVHSRPTYREVFRKTLKFCLETKAFNEVEEQIASYPEFANIPQSQYRMIVYLINAGGLEKLELDERGGIVTEDMKEGLDEDALDELVWSYALKTTDAGKAIVDELEPKMRIRDLLKAVSDRADTYVEMLEFCREPRTYDAIEKMFKSKGVFARKSLNASTSIPTHPSALLAKLEEAGGIVWNDGWTLTKEGEAWLEGHLSVTL